MSKNVVELNGVYLNLLAPRVDIFAQAMHDNADLRPMRDRLEPDWFLLWRNGVAYGMPRVVAPRTAFGRSTQLICAEHPQIVAALILDRLHRAIEAKGRRVLGRRPFRYIGDHRDLVATVCRKLRSPPAILRQFKIVGKYELNTKLLEPQDGQTSIGLFMGLGTHWEINAPLDELERAGVDLRGLAVVRRVRRPGERGLVGRVAGRDGPRILLADGYDGQNEVPLAEVWVERSRAVFAHCLRAILGDNYDDFEGHRRLEEAGFLSAGALDDWIERMIAALKEKVSPLDVGGGLRVTVGDRIQIANTPQYESVTQAGRFEYYFNRARTKHSAYAWGGIEEYGPFSAIAKHSPRIAVICPTSLQGHAKAFIDLLRLGVTGLPNSHFAQGFQRAFNLINPEFPFVTFRWGGGRDGPVADRYRLAIAEMLRTSEQPPDAAIVVIANEHAGLRDAESPYLHAKAALLMAGVPVQCVRASTLRQSAQSMQYSLQNFAVALCAKLEGSPWTVAQEARVDNEDEVVIGLGACVVRGTRFDAGARFVGITTVFRGDGNYLLSNLSDVCSYEEYPQRLRESAVKVLEEVKRRNGWQRGDTVRVTVHSYKPIREIEAAAVMKDCVEAVGREQKIKFAFVTVSHEHEFAVFDRDQVGVSVSRGGIKGRLVPERGTIVEVGRRTLLLCATGPRLIKWAGAPLPRPILVNLHPASDFDDRHYLAEQVLRFTALSWRSVLPGSEPVTIAYSEMIAEQLTRLREIPGWHLATLNEKLSSSRWFL
jgi:hypothetical protein